MNPFEEFFRKPPEERATESAKVPAAKRLPSASIGFAEAMRDISAFMRRSVEMEWTEWLEHTEQRRIGRLMRNKQFGTHRNPETKKKKAQRKRLMQKLRDKQILARVQKVGAHRLDEEERAALEVARNRQLRKKRQNERYQEKQARESENGSL